MDDKDFQSQVIELLGKVLEKQSEHDNKLNSIMEQTAKNTELTSIVNDTTERIGNLEFEVKLIKKYLKS